MNTEETAAMTAVRRPPQGCATVGHEHRFRFAIGEHGALRGCEVCGKSWLMTYFPALGWNTQWKEIKESADEQ